MVPLNWLLSTERAEPFADEGARPWAAGRSEARSAPVQSPLEPALVLDALGAGVLAFGEDGVVAFASAGATRILGRAGARLEGQRVDDLLAPVAKLLRPSASDARLEHRADLRVTLPNGSSTDLGFSVTSVADQPHAQAIHVVLFQEIGSVLELRRERDRLLQLAAVGQALPSVLHELRNPLAAVTGLLEVLLDEPDAPYAHDLHAILTELRRMSLTLQGIGGLVRSAHAEKATAIDYAVREACRILEPMATRRDITLRAIGPDMPLLRLDREVLSGVVFNLVRNAVDACGAGALVEVDARLEAEDVFALSVRDDGPGMTEEVRQRCCELFFTSKEKGSGIGLALCKRVAELSDGRLDIETVFGRGTRVTLRFPIDPSSPKPRFRTLRPAF